MEAGPDDPECPRGRRHPRQGRTAHGVALATLWSEAQALANTSLSAAQAAWDTERAEAEALRGELSEAFEAQHRELQTAQAQIARHIEPQSHQQAQIWPDQRPELRRVKCVDALCVNAQITSHEWK